MTSRMRREDGWILASSISILAMMLIMSMAAVAIVDNGTTRSREQRERESGLNLTEGVLFAQGFMLARSWPGNAVDAVPATCSEAGVLAGCPTPSNLAAAQGGANFSNVDQTADVTWITQVRDNGPPLDESYVTSAADLPQDYTRVIDGQTITTTCAAPCTWDHNGDRQMWVQARSVVRGKPRNLVALMKLETLRESTPESAIIAGGINLSNGGQQTLVSAAGSSVIVRCESNNGQLNNNCWNENRSRPNQIVPKPTAGDPGNLMNEFQLERMKARAEADGKYFATCPPDNADLSGQVVWVENCSMLKVTASTITERPCVPDLGDWPTAAGNGLHESCINSVDEPGILIMHCGRMELGGNTTYIGLVYAVNNSDGTCPAPFAGQIGGPCTSANNIVVETRGGFGVLGAIVVDGPGCLRVGSNGVNVAYDANIFAAIASYGTVGLVQNTWRELPPNG